MSDDRTDNEIIIAILASIKDKMYDLEDELRLILTALENPRILTRGRDE